MIHVWVTDRAFRPHFEIEHVEGALHDPGEDRRTSLRKTPHSLVEAENGEIALRKFKQEPFDIVLMDIQMPVMDGLEAIRAIREWEALHQLPATPIIELTASAFGGDMEKCLKAGATIHVAKPVKKAVLLASILDLTSHARGCPHASEVGEQPRLSPQ